MTALTLFSLTLSFSTLFLPHTPPHKGLQYIFYFDETPGLSLLVKTLGYTAHGTTDGATRPGSEHSPAVTVILTINMLDMVAIPHVLVANPNKTVNLADFLFSKNIFWAATVNGYIDKAMIITYAKRLRQQVGHNKPILLLTDGHAAHLAPEVLHVFARLKIRVVVIPPHTSHGLAACDQFNMRLHQHIGRVENYTIDVCEQFLKDFDEVLEETGFVKNQWSEHWTNQRRM